MTTIRRIRPLPLALIALAAICAALVLIPWVVQAQTPSVLTSNTGLTPLRFRRSRRIRGKSINSL